MTFEELQKYCQEKASELSLDLLQKNSLHLVVEIVVYDPAHGYPVRATHVIPSNIKDLPVKRWEAPAPQVSHTGKNTDTPGKAKP